MFVWKVWKSFSRILTVRITTMIYTDSIIIPRLDKLHGSWVQRKFWLVKQGGKIPNIENTHCWPWKKAVVLLWRFLSSSASTSTLCVFFPYMLWWPQYLWRLIGAYFFKYELKSTGMYKTVPSWPINGLCMAQ